MKLRLNEHYTSVQGEGPNVGEPTQFVRFSGCNLRCPGWPCDTQHAIQPALFRNDPRPEPDEIIRDVIAVRSSTGASRICITGGEPFLQPADDLRAVVQGLLDRNFSIDVFTNGTLSFPNWIANPKITVVMDWKLPGSGEGSKAVDERIHNLHMLQGKDAVKLVCANYDDLLSAEEVYYTQLQDRPFRVYVGAVWGRITDEEIVQFILDNQLPWWLNVQVHKHIWRADTRGV